MIYFLTVISTLASLLFLKKHTKIHIFFVYLASIVFALLVAQIYTTLVNGVLDTFMLLSSLIHLPAVGAATLFLGSIVELKHGGNTSMSSIIKNTAAAVFLVAAILLAVIKFI